MSTGYEVGDAPDSNIQGSIGMGDDKPKKKSTIKKIIKGSLLSCIIAPPFILFIVFSIVTVIIGGICYVKLVRTPTESCESTCGENVPHKWTLKTNCKYWDSNETISNYIKENYQVEEKYVREIKISPDPKDILKYSKILYNWGENMNITAYHYKAKNETSKGKTIIVTHDFRGCKRSFNSLLASAMLHKNGYDVLSISMRNHGNSANNGWFITFGSQENFDVSAAYTYLNTTADKVGFYGVGVGASSTLIAMTNRFTAGKTAAFLDSMPCDLKETMKSYLTKELGSKISPEYLFWQMCQSSPVFSRFSCIPFQFDPMQSSLKLKENNNITHNMHFEHNTHNSVYEYENFQSCLKQVENNKKLTVTMKTTDYEVKGENEWSPFNPNTCNSHGTNILEDMEGYERRLISFFDKALP